MRSDAVRGSSQPLMRGGWRRVAAVLCALALVGFVALAARLRDVRDTRLDRRIADWAYLHLHGTAARILFLLVDAPLSVSLVGLVVLGALLARSWRVAVWAVSTPLVALGLTEVVLKPLVHRQLGHGPDGLAFPSGHATGLASALLLLVVLVVRAPWPGWARLACVVVLGTWYLAGCLGLVRNFLHYTSDTVGGFLVAIVCVVGGALVVDVLWSRLRLS